jgi:hypothetical protein
MTDVQTTIYTTQTTTDVPTTMFTTETTTQDVHVHTTTPTTKTITADVSTTSNVQTTYVPITSPTMQTTTDVLPTISTKPRTPDKIEIDGSTILDTKSSESTTKEYNNIRTTIKAKKESNNLNGSPKEVKKSTQQSLSGNMNFIIAVSVSIVTLVAVSFLVCIMVRNCGVS